MTPDLGILRRFLPHVDACAWIGLGSTVAKRCPVRDTYNAVAVLIFHQHASGLFFCINSVDESSRPGCGSFFFAVSAEASSIGFHSMKLLGRLRQVCKQTANMYDAYCLSAPTYCSAWSNCLPPLPFPGRITSPFI